MLHRSLGGLVLTGIATTIAAQAPTLAPEHAVLRQLAGTWDVTAHPARPATATATPEQQQEVSALICGGLWLETVTRSGKNELLWLTGLDPEQHRFVRLRAGGTVAAAIEEGEFDADQHTITWRGREGVAKRLGMTTVLTLGDAGLTEHTMSRGGQPFLDRTFVRSKTDAAAEPRSGPAPPPTPDHELFARLAGDWECALTTTMPGVAQPLRSTGRMQEQLIMDGGWLRSSFHGTFDGRTIEGRGLMGFDRGQQRYVRYWVDSGSPFLSISTCTLDGASKLTGSGTTRMAGGEVTIAETTELGDDLRHVTQRLTTADGKDAGTIEMVMTRRPSPKPK